MCVIADNKHVVNEATIVSAVNDNEQSKLDSINIKPWTRQEDMLLLQSIKKEYSENSFLSISEKLANRTVEQVIFVVHFFSRHIDAYICNEIKSYLLFLGERKMPNPTCFTTENDVKYICIYKHKSIYEICIHKDFYDCNIVRVCYTTC